MHTFANRCGKARWIGRWDLRQPDHSIRLEGHEGYVSDEFPALPSNVLNDKLAALDLFLDSFV